MCVWFCLRIIIIIVITGIFVCFSLSPSLLNVVESARVCMCVLLARVFVCVRVCALREERASELKIKRASERARGACILARVLLVHAVASVHCHTFCRSYDLTKVRSCFKPFYLCEQTDKTRRR